MSRWEDYHLTTRQPTQSQTPRHVPSPPKFLILSPCATSTKKFQQQSTTTPIDEFNNHLPLTSPFTSKMPKIKRKSNGAPDSSPYSKSSSSKSAAAHSIFKMNTDLGQHILKNPGVASAIVAKAHLKQSDHVLEVGPGTGNLTVLILRQAKQVTAVEMDPRMAAEVTKRVQGTTEGKRLTVMLGDVIKTELPYFECVSFLCAVPTYSIYYRISPTMKIPPQKKYGIRKMLTENQTVYAYPTPPTKSPRPSSSSSSACPNPHEPAVCTSGVLNPI
jgi:hypothetical protein